MSDKQSRDQAVLAARRAYQVRTNKALADLLNRLRDAPRSFDAVEREAILTVAASRLWRTPDGAHEATATIGSS